MERQTQLNIWYVLAAALLIWALQDVRRHYMDVESIPYSRFEALLDAGEIDRVVVAPDHIRGRYTYERPDGRTRFVTTPVPPHLAERLRAAGVEFTAEAPNPAMTALVSWVLPALVFFGIWFFAIRKLGEKYGMGGGLMAVGKSRAKVYVEKNTGTRFADVAGVDEAKAELAEVVEFLKDPQRYGALGARVPKGVLLVGPPGTGKTLLARAVAGEAGVPFFSISGSEFVEMFVGVGAARVRDLFEQASRHAPSIIFVDELDALGRARGAGGPAAGHDEREHTLNQLLVELDGFDARQGLVLLAATNRPEILDPALLRAGRFDRQVLVDRPDKAGRAAILRVHMSKVRVAPEVDPEQVAALTTGFTGADLANLVNEAALLATRERREAVDMSHFTRAVERIVAGLEKKNRLINAEERRVVAYHETGHALVSMLLPGCDPVHKVSIIPRGVAALGYTIQRPTEDRYLMRQEELENKIAVLLGGRAAEWLVFGRLSTGAADDIAKATDIARSMVVRYGMDPRLGHLSYEEAEPGLLGARGWPRAAGRPFSDATAREIDQAVQGIVKRQFERSVELLRANREVLERCAEALLAQETLDREALRRLTHDLRPLAAAQTETAGEAAASSAA